MATDKNHKSSAAPVICVGSGKGGNGGKTTITLNLAAGFAWKRQFRVCVIDADKSMNLTEVFGVVDPETTLNEALECLLPGADESRLSEVVARALTQFTLHPDGDDEKAPLAEIILFPAKKKLIEMAARLSDSRVDAVSAMSRVIDEVQALVKPDLILVDTAGHLDMLVMSVAAASDYCILPTDLSKLGLKGVELFTEMLGDLESMKAIKPDFGVLVSKFDRSVGCKGTNIDNMMNLARKYPDRVLTSSIRKCNAFVKAQEQDLAVFEFEQTKRKGVATRAEEDILALASELSSLLGFEWCGAKKNKKKRKSRRAVEAYAAEANI